MADGMNKEDILRILGAITRKLENGINLIDKIPQADELAGAAYRAGFARHEITAAVEGIKDLLIEEIKEKGLKDG